MKSISIDFCELYSDSCELCLQNNKNPNYESKCHWSNNSCKSKLKLSQFPQSVYLTQLEHCELLRTTTTKSTSTTTTTIITTTTIATTTPLIQPTNTSIYKHTTNSFKTARDRARSNHLDSNFTSTNITGLVYNVQPLSENIKLSNLSLGMCLSFSNY